MTGEQFRDVGSMEHVVARASFNLRQHTCQRAEGGVQGSVRIQPDDAEVIVTKIITLPGHQDFSVRKHGDVPGRIPAAGQIDVAACATPLDHEVAVGAQPEIPRALADLPGLAKTRLIPALGAEGAASFQRELSRAPSARSSRRRVAPTQGADDSMRTGTRASSKTTSA